MGLKIINSGYEKNELSKNAMGGTEMMQAELYRRLDSDLLSNFQIVASRVRDLDPSKIKIFWAHDLAEDAEARFLQNENLRDRFDKLVFVSHWQFATYNKVLDVPYDNSIVLRNAINPFEKVEKSLDGPIRLIYHTTPHRGLNILVAAYHELSKLYGDKIHLDVFSSFKIYGWEERDEPYRDLFKACEDHPHITYHGTKSNDEVREALSKSHIFAYPSIWQETSCIAAIEAMSAGCQIVCPAYAALPETTAGFAYMYPWTTDLHVHANRFANVLKDAIDEQLEMRENNLDSPTLAMQKIYADSLYSWDNREKEWEALLRSMKNELSS
jgi:UDP-glucose:(glucosyl)LPS alpha-1,2-glucosyltransferase